MIEQLPGKPFNRAKLFNIGFQEAKVSPKKYIQGFRIQNVFNYPSILANLHAFLQIRDHLVSYLAPENHHQLI